MNLEEAQTLGLELMRANGLGGTGWVLGFDNAKRRFGLCDYNNKRISLSRYLVELNDEPQVRDTILHEIAHVLTPGHGHDLTWQHMCLQVGADPQRYYDHEEVAVPAMAKRRHRWEGNCPNCGLLHQRHRLPKHGGVASCAACSPTYDERYRIQWRDVIDGPQS